MKPEYLPVTLNGKLAHLSEECAEVIQTVAKAQRFGLFGRYDDGERNDEAILREIRDARIAMTRFEVALDEATHGPDLDPCVVSAGVQGDGS